MYNRTIVCDIDDTISFTTSRDWQNAKPNKKLIDKLNNLYDNGWTIIYSTARGSLSCKNRDEAKKKYEPIILEWFNKNNVKFTKLSFNKDLAMYYIDDKSILPEDFLTLDIQVLKGGLTNAVIEKHGNKVFKTDKNSLSVAAWFNKAKDIIKTLNVYSVVGDTICIDYIEKSEEPNVDSIFKIIEKFSEVKRYEPFSLYIERIQSHMDLYSPSYYNTVIKYYKEIEDFCNLRKSFCHGDFTLDNMISNNGTIYLIDPIYDNCYSSYLLDISKLLQSCRRFNNYTIKNFIEEKYFNILRVLKILELGHWIRMRKYTEDKDFVDNNISIVLKELETE